jgi:hypothetical protein
MQCPLRFCGCHRAAIISLVLTVDGQRLEATMRILKAIVGLTILLVAAGCAYYGPRPYYYEHPRYYRY